MEIDVTAIVIGMADRLRFFACSRAEMGENAGELSWEWALDAARELREAGKNLLSDTQLAAFREYVADFGAWKREEINAWTDEECEALFIQFVAEDARERQNAADEDRLEEYEEYEENEGGRLWVEKGRALYYVRN